MEFITSGDRIATENFSIGKIYTVTFTNGNYFINTCVGIGPDFVMFQQEAPKMLFCLDMESAETVSSIDESSGGSGTTNYNELENKPSINGVTLIGNNTAADLSILPVPIVGENDNNKILTASYSGGVGSYSWQPAPSSGTTDYTQLTNKPQINSVELSGNKSLADLGIASAEALAGKQDVISDLSTIRSGAAAGATAVQPATLAGYQTLIDSSHKLSSDLIDDEGHTNKFATAAQLTQIETNKTNISSIESRTGTKNYFNFYGATINPFSTTVTNNGDGSFTVKYNGTLSSITTPYIYINLSAGQYVLSGCPSGGSGDTYSMDLRTSTGQGIENSTDYGSGSNAVTVTGGDYRLAFRFANGYTFPADGVTFKPMICTPEQWAITHDYQPYVWTNKELTAWILAQS